MNVDVFFMQDPPIDPKTAEVAVVILVAAIIVLIVIAIVLSGRND